MRGVIEFVGPLAQATVKELQRPDGVVPWVNTGRHLAHIPGDLGVPRQDCRSVGCWFQRAVRRRIQTVAWLEAGSFLCIRSARAASRSRRFRTPFRRRRRGFAEAARADERTRAGPSCMSDRMVGRRTRKGPASAANMRRRGWSAKDGRGSGLCWSKRSPRRARCDRHGRYERAGHRGAGWRGAVPSRVDRADMLPAGHVA